MGLNSPRGAGQSLHSTLAREGRQPELLNLQLGRNHCASKASTSPKGSQKVIQDSSGVDLTQLVNLVKKRIQKDARYGNLINIISDTSTLQAAYLAIKGKSGNMTKGLDNETLDGIDLKYFSR